MEYLQIETAEHGHKAQQKSLTCETKEISVQNVYEEVIYMFMRAYKLFYCIKIGFQLVCF